MNSQSKIKLFRNDLRGIEEVTFDIEFWIKQISRIRVTFPIRSVKAFLQVLDMARLNETRGSCSALRAGFIERKKQQNMRVSVACQKHNIGWKISKKTHLQLVSSSLSHHLTRGHKQTKSKRALHKDTALCILCTKKHQRKHKNKYNFYNQTQGDVCIRLAHLLNLGKNNDTIQIAPNTFAV